MTPTTTSALSTAFIAAMRTIVPTFEHERVSTWRHTPSPRERGAGALFGAGLRSFDLVWGPGLPSFLWYGTGHEAYQATLRVGTSYQGVPPDLLEHMITADAIDLRRMFAQLPEPTVPGLSHVEALGVGDFEIDDTANAVVEHTFRVHWAQLTD